MFGITYFIGYEAYKTESILVKGFDTFKLGIFQNINDYVDAYCDEVARVNGIDVGKIVITQLNKLN